MKNDNKLTIKHVLALVLAPISVPTLFGLGFAKGFVDSFKD